MVVKLPLIVLRISAITITISTGDDLIGSSGSNVKLYGGTGNDTLMFWCTEANDTATSNYLDAGDGNNNINIYEYYQNDEFVRRIENMIVNAGSGYDSILVLSDKTTINAGGGSDKVWNVGKSNVINLGSGNDFAVNEYWSESYVAINGESGNDLLFNHGRYATINGGNDNDTIYNGGGNNSFLNGDAGNDVIVNGHNDPSSVEHYETYSEESEHVDVATLVADTSDRALVVSNVTLKGGKGNDTIAISSKSLMNVLQYASGDGNDIITNYSSHDTIQITNGLYSTQTSGNDVIIKIGSNSINLKNAKGTTLNIAGTTSDKVSVASDAVTYNGHSYKLYTLGKT
ncbi:MAG: hypothetical protein IJ563_11300, partial [Selenomonadaceae bacterium]|nr:hypothetical protein [Selenomonadaceae bacterium]